MSRIRPLDVADLSVDQKAQIEAVESLLGFVANDALIMGKSPALSNAVAALVAVIAMFGFLNRWNSTLAKDLESLPSESLRKLGE